jgi:D-alanyl-D-alanine carboxypeptidase (penicillin-binding protein 5/6)
VLEYFEKGQSTTDGPADVLKLGATGQLVQAVQRTLNARLDPSPNLSIDGDFGPATEAAVKALQESKSLKATGEVGPETFKALGPLVEAEPVPAPETVNAAELPRQPRESLDGPPLVTCKAWAIGDAKTGELLHGSRESDKLDIASTTKMMVAQLVCQMAKDDPKVLEEIVTFSAAADKTVGSTADVREGEQVSVGELLYGLMLPSGNDAATALAEHFGGKLTSRHVSGHSDSSAAAFIAEMNRQAKELGMAETNYANPHGLTARDHKSSARDQLKLAHAALANPLFRKYISTRQHGTTVTGPGGYQRNLVWKNTNRLLEMEGYVGVKTGTTSAAGACLVACGERDGRELIVVVLGSTSSDARYIDSRNLFRWAWTYKPAAEARD